MVRNLWLVIMLCVALVSAPAQAEVVMTFYSHDYDKYFPHAFITVKGTVDATGEVVDTNYGFTAVSVSPALLLGSVKGMIETKDAPYVSSSDPHFTLQLSDEDYARLMAHVEKWRTIPGKSYSLNKRNCVHFVMETAAMFGLTVNRKSKFFKKPKSFVLEMMRLNPAVKL